MHLLQLDILFVFFPNPEKGFKAFISPTVNALDDPNPLFEVGISNCNNF